MLRVEACAVQDAVAGAQGKMFARNLGITQGRYKVGFHWGRCREALVLSSTGAEI